MAGSSKRGSVPEAEIKRSSVSECCILYKDGINGCQLYPSFSLAVDCICKKNYKISWLSKVISFTHRMKKGKQASKTSGVLLYKAGALECV